MKSNSLVDLPNIPCPSKITHENCFTLLCGNPKDFQNPKDFLTLYKTFCVTAASLKISVLSI